jgi:GNAT superfamily N-acetyltransferase
LQTSPEAFGSNYAREVAFTDDIWYNRLVDPKAATFFALQDGRIVGTITVLGPIDFSPEEFTPSANPWEVTGGTDQAELHYRYNGVFTLPEARGKGVAKALIEKGKEFAHAQAKTLGKPFVASLVVETENVAARTLYERSGFSFLKEEHYTKYGRSMEVVLLTYGPVIP